MSPNQCLTNLGWILLCHPALSFQNPFSEGPLPLILFSPITGFRCFPKISFSMFAQVFILQTTSWEAEGLQVLIGPVPPQANDSSSDVWLLFLLSTHTTQGWHPDMNLLAHSSAIWSFPGGQNGVIICIRRKLSPPGVMLRWLYFHWDTGYKASSVCARDYSSQSCLLYCL